jgi:hypothetical protein
VTGRPRLGVVLPLFQPDGGPARAVAAQAEAEGLDGVFCYDHLWPLGQPERPALAPFPVLGALSLAHPGLVVGPLVARVGLVPDDVVVGELAALAALAPGRVVAGLGTGDGASAAENRAFGLPYPPAEERRAALASCTRRLLALGIEVWVGGKGRTGAVGADAGAAVNLWHTAPEEVARRARTARVTWAGPVPAGPDGEPDAAALARLVDDLGRAGATWAVFGTGAPLDLLGALARG